MERSIFHEQLAEKISRFRVGQRVSLYLGFPFVRAQVDDLPVPTWIYGPSSRAGAISKKAILREGGGRAETEGEGVFRLPPAP